MIIGDLLRKWILGSRVKIITGHFGTGKTELAVNLAMLFGELQIPYILADLDVVDPYFRSREQKDHIENGGGILITSSQACMNADVPSMPPDVVKVFDDRERYAVMDIGGDASGARVLAQYKNRIDRENAEMICVLNANRPFTKTAEEAAAYIRAIEEAAGIEISGLINNTHMMGETLADDIRRGAEVAREAAAISGKHLIGHSVKKNLLNQAEEIAGEGELIIPMDIYMRKPWE